jgi:hypothetical protein
MSIAILPFVGMLAFASIAMSMLAYFYALKKMRTFDGNIYGKTT